MTDLLQTGAAFLAAKLKSDASHEVTYARGAASVAVYATVGTSEHQNTDDDGVTEIVVTRDYLVTPADLVIAGSAVEPRPGDRITETIAGASETFEVMRTGTQPCFVRTGNQWRIFTKRITP
jgi:hypothetical protein